MKKLFKDASGWVALLPLLFLQSCSPAFGGGGFVAPVGLFLAAGWTWLRYFGIVPSTNKDTGEKLEKKGKIGTLVFAIIWTLAGIVVTYLMGRDL